MHRPGADLDRVAALPDARQARDARDVDQQPRFAQAQLHQRHEAVPARDQLAGALGILQFRNRVLERCRARVVEWRRDHDRPFWMIRQSFSGRSIMSTWVTPTSLSASTAAETMHGVAPSVPASPTPFAP